MEPKHIFNGLWATRLEILHKTKTDHTPIDVKFSTHDAHAEISAGSAPFVQTAHAARTPVSQWSPWAQTDDRVGPRTAPAPALCT